MNTFVANKLEQKLGDRPTATTNEPKVRSDETMLALCWHGDKDVRIEEVPVPAITEPTGVIYKVTSTTVCGSDLHLYHKEIMQLQKGEILEMSRWGLSMSEERRPSRCEFSDCEKLYGKPFAGLFDYSHLAGGFAGGQAEHVRTPFANFNLLKIPDSVPDEKALYLSDIPTSYHSTVCAEVKKGKSVAVWGLGPVGLFACKWSKLAGARRVIAIDQVAERLALAKNAIGCDIIDFSVEKDVVKTIYDLEPEGIDCVIDVAAFRYMKGLLYGVQRATGLETDTSEIINGALRAAHRFGNIALVADYAEMTNQFLIRALMEMVADKLQSRSTGTNC